MIRTVLLALLSAFCLPAMAQGGLTEILAAADRLAPLETVIVAHGGKILAEQGYDGHAVTDPTNIKSASKTIISALVGIAIDRGVLKGVDQPIVEILADQLP